MMVSPPQAPEKLEQRAKPRRRNHHSPHDSNSPQHILTGPSSVGSSNTNAYPPFMPSPHSSHVPLGHVPISHTSLLQNSNIPLQFMNSMEFVNYLNPNHSGDLSMINETYSSNIENKECNFSASNVPKSILAQKSQQNCIPLINRRKNESHELLSMGSSRVSQTNYKRRLCKRLSHCHRTNGRTLCKHRSCRLLNQRRKRRQQRLRKVKRVSTQRLLNIGALTEPDPHLLNCLQDCIRRIREPFTPEEQLETGVAVTLEQEYNRMDACIRRIIRVVKLLPYFGNVGKPAQLRLLRTNIYGLIVLYSSFFFERDIRKLRYPVLQSDGQLTTVTVSMLDEVVTPSTSSNEVEEISNESDQKLIPPNYIRSGIRSQTTYAIGLREEFELYKANTLAAFDHLDQLIRFDDVLRMSVLAIKLFTDNSLPEDVRAPICSARQAYSNFLWNYIRWQAGPKKLRLATESYARLLIAFIDLRTLEIRMTEFAKLLSLDGLSPLMREVCSQRNTLGSTCS